MAEGPQLYRTNSTFSECTFLQVLTDSMLLVNTQPVIKTQLLLDIREQSRAFLSYFACNMCFDWPAYIHLEEYTTFP